MKQVIISYKKEHSLRERLLLWLLGFVVPVHTIVYHRRKPWGLYRQDLLRYAPGTLGRELGLFLEREQLQPIPRIERHDAFHILLGFTTDVIDEAAMQFFLIGNGKSSPFTLSTAIFSGTILPEQLQRFRYEYRRGKAARSIAKWDFLELLDEPIEEVRRLIFRQPVYNQSLLEKVALFETSAAK